MSRLSLRRMDSISYSNATLASRITSSTCGEPTSNSLFASKYTLSIVPPVVKNLILSMGKIRKDPCEFNHRTKIPVATARRFLSIPPSCAQCGEIDTDLLMKSYNIAVIGGDGTG